MFAEVSDLLIRLQIPEYEVLTGSHRFNIKSTNWWVNLWVKRISGVKMVGRDKVVRDKVINDFDGTNEFFRFFYFALRIFLERCLVF